MTSFLALSGRKARRKRADERTRLIRTLMTTLLSDPKLAALVVERKANWIAEVARTVRWRVERVLKGEEDNAD